MNNRTRKDMLQLGIESMTISSLHEQRGVKIYEVRVSEIQAIAYP